MVVVSSHNGALGADQTIFGGAALAASVGVGVPKKPSPAISFVGRHNSGKTTLLEKVIRELIARGVHLATVKHHGHPDFDIDYPGKDSYRHRMAGSRDTVIVSPTRMARVRELDHELECNEIVAAMPDYDLIIVEGFRMSGLPIIEVLRSGNERDLPAAGQFCQTGRIRDVAPVALVSDIPEVFDSAAKRGLPCFGLEDIALIADFLQAEYVRPKLTVVVQAGGESKRMGRSKATVPFLGAPLLERIVKRVAPVADELIVTTNEPESLGFLHDLDLPCDVRLARDSFQERGALRGLHTALAASSSPLTAVVACDMVFASAGLILAEAHVLHGEKADAVVPFYKNGFEPFHGVYRTKECLRAVEAALAAGNERARDFFESIQLRRFSSAEVAAAAPERCCFTNVNTPEELAKIEALILEEGDR